jgi:nucleoside-diphosphate-sugar epimerase
MILVAGGDGFLGRPFCDLLHQSGASILSLDVHPSNSRHYPTVACDLRDRESVERVFEEFPISVIVNLAAILVSASKVDPITSFQVNVTGSFNLLDISRKYDVSRFVFGSSYSALGEPSQHERPIDEQVSPQPTDFYGHTKAFIERLGITLSHLCGVQFISARMPMIVGPGKATSTSAWRAEMFNLLPSGGDLLIDYDPDEVLPLAHYEVLSEAIMALTLAKKLDHHIYHLPYENWRVRELGQLLEEFNPRLEIAYGTRRMNNSPISLSWKRIESELGLQQPSLRERLQKEIDKSSL